MCGRFNLHANPALLAEIFQLLRQPDWSPRYNIAPSQPVLVIRQQADGTRLGERLRWGLIPSWADDPAIGSKMINARSESIATKPAFRDAFRRRRCLVPANGFYEWEKITTKEKQPWHIFSRSDALLTFAGLWDTWNSPDGEKVETCTILTTDANPFMSPVHDRMPVILPMEAFGAWLDPGLNDPAALQQWLVPSSAEGLDREPVGKLVNSPCNDSPKCIQPVKPPRGLFD